MAVNYDDERFQQVTREQDQAIQNVQNTYNNMINQTKDLYQQQVNEAQRYGQEQQALQQANTDFAIQNIEIEKERANQDYLKEQKGAYADWQKQSNQYGVQAEQQASAGLRNGGYSESSQVAMYNQYQNRVATAKQSYDRTVVDYNQAIKEAQLTNNAKLAEIAYNTMQTKLTLNLEGFQYQNDLMKEQLQMLNQEKDRYYNRWQDVLSQINYENEQAEQQRQYEEQMALQRASLGYKYGGSGSSGGIDTSIGEEIDTKADAEKYGTFSNGYQPKGISGYGLLSPTGRTAVAPNGKTQNVWQTKDENGNVNYWFWDGDTRTYVPFANFYSTKAVDMGKIGSSLGSKANTLSNNKTSSSGNKTTSNINVIGKGSTKGSANRKYDMKTYAKNRINSGRR